MNNTQCLNFLKELATVLRFQQLLIKKVSLTKADTFIVNCYVFIGTSAINVIIMRLIRIAGRGHQLSDN